MWGIGDAGSSYPVSIRNNQYYSKDITIEQTDMSLDVGDNLTGSIASSADDEAIAVGGGLHSSLKSGYKNEGIDSGIESMANEMNIYINIHLSSVKPKLTKCLQFNAEDTVWTAKLRVLSTIGKDLKDGYNFGFYIPPENLKAGKFLDECRKLSEYPLSGSIGNLEFIPKARLHKILQDTEIRKRKLKQIKDKTNLKQFMLIVREGQVRKVEKILAKGLDPNFNETDKNDSETPLAAAVRLPSASCRQMIMELVNGGAHLDFRTRTGRTPLHLASRRANISAVKALLDLGASTDVRDRDNLTPLYLACCSTLSSSIKFSAARRSDHNKDSATVVEMLLNDHATTGTTDVQGWTEVHQCCRGNHVKHLDHLLFYGAEMNARNSGGNTPLHVSSLNNQESCIRSLLLRGADKEIVNFNDQTAYECALIAGNLVVAHIIKDFNTKQAVPYQEMPTFNTKRRRLSTQSTNLLRSRSNPSINLLGNCSLNTYSFDDSLSYASAQTFSSPHTNNYGTAPRLRPHIYPPGRSEDDSKSVASLFDTVDNDCSSPQARSVILQKTKHGYGFVLCGAKYKDKRYGDEFRPSRKTPALQYLSDVFTDGFADRAGLKKGDFLLRINGEDVVSATHELASRLIKSSRAELRLTVIASILDNVDNATLLSPNTQTLNKSLSYEDGTKTLPLPKRVKSPVHCESRMSFDISTSPVLMNSLNNNNNNVKQKNSNNNATASIRSRSSKKLTTVPLDEIFLQSHLISEQIANYKSLPRKSGDNQRLQPDILDNLYSKTLRSTPSEEKGIDIPPPPSHRPPSPPNLKNDVSTERKYSILRELEKETSTFRPLAQIPSPPTMQAPCPPNKPIPPPPHMDIPKPIIAPPKPLTTPRRDSSIKLTPPPLPKTSSKSSLSSAPPPPPPPPSASALITPLSTPTRNNSLDMTSMAAQIANVNLKTRSQDTRSPSVVSNNSSSSMSSDLMQAISRRRCIVDAPPSDEHDIERKMAAVRNQKSNSNSPKPRLSTDGSPNLGFKALAEQRRQQWLNKQKVVKNNEEVNPGEIARMVAERAKRMTPLVLDKPTEPRGHSTVFPSSTSPVSPSTARRIISENLPPPPLLITEDAMSLASSGVASTYSSVADESPSSSRHKVYTINQIPAEVEVATSPVILPPPAFADNGNKDCFSSLRSAMRSSQDDLASL